IYSSELVVEGRIVNGDKEVPPECARLRITAVHRGDVKAGQTVVVWRLKEYRKPAGSGTSNVALGPKDHLVMFLKRLGPDQAGNRLSRGDVFVPNDALQSDCGMRLVVRGRVCGF